MIVKIENTYLEKLYSGKEIKGKPKYADQIISKFRKTIDQIKFTETLSELKKFRGLNFEALSGNFKGKYSVRVDIKYRLILRIEQNKIVVDEIIVEDLTNHYK